MFTIITIALAVHRQLHPVVAQNSLMVVRTVFAATVAMEDAAPRRGPERDGHSQRAGRQIAFQAITDGSADYVPGVQVHHRPIEPALAGPDIADVTRPFLIGLTFITRHSRSIGKAPRFSSTNLNLTAIGSRRTGGG